MEMEKEKDEEKKEKEKIFKEEIKRINCFFLFFYLILNTNIKRIKPRMKRI